MSCCGHKQGQTLEVPPYVSTFLPQLGKALRASLVPSVLVRRSQPVAEAIGLTMFFVKSELVAAYVPRRALDFVQVLARRLGGPST